MMGRIADIIAVTPWPQRCRRGATPRWLLAPCILRWQAKREQLGNPTVGRPGPRLAAKTIASSARIASRIQATTVLALFPAATGSRTKARKPLLLAAESE